MDDFLCASSEFIENWNLSRKNESLQIAQTNILNEYISTRLKSQFTIDLDMVCKMELLNVPDNFCLMSHLLNRVIILDFFTYCCVNCLHIMPILHQIEEKYEHTNKVALIGVHSAKFFNERLSSSILSALARYNISHPVINDCDLQLWRHLCITCWPTVVVIGPSGRLLLALIGESDIDTLPVFIDAVVSQLENQMAPHRHLVLDSVIKTVTPVEHILKPSKLSFPGGLCLAFLSSSDDSTQRHLVVVDSGNHRLLVIDCRDFSVQMVVGNGVAGIRDGDLSDCSFNNPQGVCSVTASVGSSTNQQHCLLFVADTGNHSIRMVDLTEGVVTTVVRGGGRGSGSTHNSTSSGGDIDDNALLVADSPVRWQCYAVPTLKSPWDVCVVNSAVLYIAVAGSHQIWLYDILSASATNCPQADGVVRCVAGSGVEGCRNNVYPQHASFAQPSGVSYCRQLSAVIVADAESSSVRLMQLLPDVAGSGDTPGFSVCAVKSVVGAGTDPTDLFVYGDVDCRHPSSMSRNTVRLQHPLAVECDNSGDSATIYVADTYNHKVKMVREFGAATSTSKSARQYTCVSLCGGQKGYSDGTFEQTCFDEPGAVCLDEGGHCLYVADTNNHRVCRLNLKQRRSETVKLKFFPEPESRGGSLTISDTVSQSTVDSADSCVVALPAVSMAVISGHCCRVSVQLVMPQCVSLTQHAPHSWEISQQDGSGVDWTVSPRSAELDTIDDRTCSFSCQITCPPLAVHTSRRSEHAVFIRLQLYVCSSGGLCYHRSVLCRLPIVSASSYHAASDQNDASTCADRDKHSVVVKLSARHLNITDI